MQFLKIYRNILKYLSIALLFILFSNVILQIFARAFLATVPTWTEEVGKYSIVWLTALGAGLFFIERDPIGIDSLFKRFSNRWQKIVTLLILALSSIFSLALVYGSLDLVKRGMSIRTPVLNLQFSYIYSGLTVTGLVISIALISKIVQLLMNSSEQIPLNKKEGEV
jgi:TRAP-type C4-dicarboxylate transport system permease small subunit